MDWDLIRVFIAVARHGQLLRAARSLALNHATVSRRLDNLEAALGTLLFERRPAGCVVTHAGELLLPVAERIEAELLSVTETLRDADAEVAGTVRVGAPDGIGNYFLAGCLGQLANRHPKLTVELVPLPRTFSLARREADLAVVIDPPTDDRLLMSRLSDYTISIYASRSYLETRGRPETVEELHDHIAVTGADEFAYASALDYARALDLHANGLFRCASVMGQMEAVRAGTGIGILHDFAASLFPELVRILPQVSFRRSYFLVAHPDTAAARRVKACRNAIVRMFREQRGRFLPRG